jgi:hypothetical protein
LYRYTSGGQVLCSSLSLKHISSETLKFFHVKDLGTFLLKGIQVPEHIFQLSSPPLDLRKFPELNAPRANHDGDDIPHSTAGLDGEVMGSSSRTQRTYSENRVNGVGNYVVGATSFIAPTTEVASQLDEEQRNYLAAFDSVALSHNAMKARFVRLAQKTSGVLGVVRSGGSGGFDLLPSLSSGGSGFSDTFQSADLVGISEKPLDDDTTARTLDLEEELVYIDSWGKFDVFAVERLSGGHALTAVVLATLKALNLHTKLSLDMKLMEKFCMKIERRYEDNSYHAAMHAADVTQAVAVILLAAHHNAKLVADEGSENSSNVPFTSTPGTPFLTPLQEFALVVSAAIHDVGHPGLNNKFLVDTGSHFARLYHDRSVNENMHLDIAFKLLEAPEHNVMGMLEQSSQRDLRRMLIRIVLQTDMAFHGELTGRFLDVAEANKGQPVKVGTQPVQVDPFLDPQLE